MKKYDLGYGWTAEIEKTSSGYFKVTVTEDACHKNVFKTMHSNELDALKEILSYCEED